MMNKIKNNVAFYAAALNLVASGFFFQGFRQRWVDPSDVSDAFGAWFFMASVALWIVYVVLYFTLSARKKREG